MIGLMGGRLAHLDWRWRLWWPGWVWAGSATARTTPSDLDFKSASPRLHPCSDAWSVKPIQKATELTKAQSEALRCLG
jgi:hypothetical protein